MSFSIASRSEHLSHRLFVEASAGTGKTYVIEHYITRMALSMTFDPQKLALITFTKAVARELRLRLRTTLQSTLVAITAEGGPPQEIPDYLRAMLEEDGFCRRKMARSLEEVIEGMGSASITTIHGFCDRLLKRWGEEEAVGRGEEWVGEEEKRQWIEEFLGEGGGLRAWEVDSISRVFSHDQTKLVARLATLIEEVDDAKDLAWEEAEQAAKAVREKIDGSRVAECLELKARGCKGTMRRDRSLRQDVARAFSALQQIIVEGLTDEALEVLAEEGTGKWFDEPLKKKSDLVSEADDVARIVMTELWPALMPLVNGEGIVRRLASRAARAYWEYVERSGKKTPETVVRRVLELSTEPSFLACAANAVSWLVVDEFQDTDSVQYTILSRLFLENPLWNGRVLFVGDPKQAIYGFRHADVYSYLAAKKCLLPSEVRTLAVNYRADMGVVAAQNRLFAGPEQRWVFYLPRAQTSLTVVPSLAGKTAERRLNDGRGALHLFMARDRLGRKKRWPHDDFEEQGLFPWMADEMIAVEHLGIAYRQQAVLVKDRHQARRVQEYLTARGIPTCAWRVDTVTDSPMYGWLCQAFFLAARPHDLHRLSTLLLSMPTEEHLELCRSMAAGRRLDQWAACATAWEEVQQAFVQGGIARMARALFSCRWNGSESLEEWLRTRPAGAKLLIDLEHLLELLSLLDTMVPHSLEAYGEALGDLSRYFSDDAEALVRRVDPDDEGVPILTMHRSKGLEFDIVYALGCASRTKCQEVMPIDEADAEKLRQLYVSITRAKCRCYLPLLIDDDAKKIPLGEASPVELLFAAHTAGGEPSSSWTERLYESMAGDVLLARADTLCADLPGSITMSAAAAEQRQLAPLRTAAASPPSCSLVLPRCHRRRYSSFTSSMAAGDRMGREASPEALQRAAAACPLADSNDRSLAVAQPKERASKNSSAAVFGAAFHEAIAKLLFAPAEVRTSAAAVKAWLHDEGREEVEMAQLLYDAVQVRLPIDDGELCLEEVPREAMRAECAFLDREDGDRYLRGVVDLVFLWKERVYVVDWKTHEASGGEWEAIAQQEYELQHRLYVEAVVRAFTPRIAYGGFFFVFVRHLNEGGIVGECGGGHGV